MKKWIYPLIPFVVVVLLVEWLTRIAVIPFYISPRPSEILMVFFDDSGELLLAAWQTLLSALTGLVMSFVLGFVFAALLSTSDALRKIFLPYALFFQTVPVIALAPILVIWFGYGYPTVVASAFICSFFPIVASTLLGLLSTEKSALELFQLYNATAWDRFFKLRLPSALPSLFSGLKIAAGLAVIGAVVGEFIGGGGLGNLIDAARTQQRLDKVFAAVFISSLIGLVFFASLNHLAWMFLHKWHASERQSS